MMDKKPENYVDINKIYDKNILITGGTNGIGEETAYSLGRLGANVYIHGRDTEKGEKIVNHLQNDIGTDSKFFKCDFSNLDDVYELSKSIKKEINEIDVLINNAGVMLWGNKTGSKDLEYTFVTNYLSTFVITIELIPLLLTTNTQSQIIFTSSSSHRHINELHIENVNESRNNWESYARSKLANIMLSLFLSRKLDENKIVTRAVHPGMITNSKILRNVSGIFEGIGSIMTYIPLPGVCSKSKGAATLINAINSDAYSGVYYNRFNPEMPSILAQDMQVQDMLWDYSIDITDSNQQEYIN